MNTNNVINLDFKSRKSNTPGIEIVTLDNYWSCAETPYVRELLGEIHLLRKMGYGPDYPKHFLPFDNTDYFCIHHLFFQTVDGKRNLVGGFRQVTLESCDFYRMDIPLYELVKKENAEQHTHVLSELISSHRKSQANLIYSSALTIKKSFRQDRDLSKTILELVPALTLYDMKTRNVPTVVGAAAPRFKTDITFQKWGYTPIQYQGSTLPPFARRSIDEANDPALVLTLTSPSEYTLECFEKHRKLVENKTVINRETIHDAIAA